MLPKPYYDHAGITIYNADCRDLLPELDTESVHCVLTDPPYASGTRTEAGKSTKGKADTMLRGGKWHDRPIENDQMTTHGFVWLLGFASREWRRVLVEGGSALVFIDWRQWPNLLGVLESSNLRACNMLVWDKQHFGLGAGFRVQHELIAHVSKGTPIIHSHGKANILSHRRDDNSLHPSPKPEPLLHDLLSVCTEEGDVVLDPFMGAGATLVAARDMGRRAIGMEVETRYCDHAIERLAQKKLF